MDVDLLIRASRQAYRFPSSKGLLCMEDLWDLPLNSNNQTTATLDSVAKGISRTLRGEVEETFVDAKPSPKITMLNDQLNILRGIIEIRQKENKLVLERRQRAEQRTVLLDALKTKENQELSAATKEELLKKLADLDA